MDSICSTNCNRYTLHSPESLSFKTTRGSYTHLTVKAVTASGCARRSRLQLVDLRLRRFAYAPLRLCAASLMRRFAYAPLRLYAAALPLKKLSLRLRRYAYTSLSLRLGAFASLRTSSIAMTVSSGKNSSLAQWNYSQSRFLRESRVLELWSTPNDTKVKNYCWVHYLSGTKIAILKAMDLH
jgi:hypothetical protein